MKKLKALDLFCGAGGASRGLADAGYEVTGVDLFPQKRYPYKFIQADALTFPLTGFDFVWASPICKRFSSATRTSKTKDNWPDQIGPIRDHLNKFAVSWVIENVAGAPLINPVMLCGAMFNLRTYRHRFFEANFKIYIPIHPEHKWPVVKMGRPAMPGYFLNPIGHFSGAKENGQALAIDWMVKSELCQAIPPAYSKYIAEHMNPRTRAPA